MGNISESSFRGAFFGLIVGLGWTTWPTSRSRIMGLGMKPPQFLKAGDVVELGIGRVETAGRCLFGAAALFALGLIAAHEHAH
jgi:hypothetical protein